MEEFNQALRNQLDRLKQAYGPEFDSQLLNTPEMRKGILDDLISRKVISMETKKSSLVVTDETLQKNAIKLQLELGTSGSPCVINSRTGKPPVDRLDTSKGTTHRIYQQSVSTI